VTEMATGLTVGGWFVSAILDALFEKAGSYAMTSMDCSPVSTKSSTSLEIP